MHHLIHVFIMALINIMITPKNVRTKNPLIEFKTYLWTIRFEPATFRKSHVREHLFD